MVKTKTALCWLAAGMALAAPAAQAADPDEVHELGKALLGRGSDGLRVDPAGQGAINRLVSIGSPEAVAVLRDFLTTYGADRKLKQQALAGLGRIGTRQAVAAIGEFEAWARKTNPSPPLFRFGPKDHAIDHFAPHDLKPLARAKDANGAEWAVFRWQRYGSPMLWLTHATGKDTWSPPVLTDADPGWLEGKSELTLSIDRGRFRLVSTSKELPLDIKPETYDADKDGLPDVVEKALGTDPTKADTDGDGANDGRDGNPLTPAHRDADDETEIRQAVFLALFATCSSQDAICLVDRQQGRGGEPNRATPATPPEAQPEWSPFARQEYHGYGGTIVRDRQLRRGWVNVTGITVKIESPDAATADISDWEGSEAASGHRARLKKLHGRWVVVEFGMTWIS